MSLENMRFKSELPYPDVTVERKNPLEAKKLMNDYGGRESETTAIMSYVYQSYVLKDAYPEIAEALEQIGITEMLHHELLGRTIFNLGGFPVIGGRNNYWNGSFVGYSTDVKRILEWDIAGEEQAIFNYKRTIQQLTDNAVIALIERIILDEELHVDTLKALLASL